MRGIYELIEKVLSSSEGLRYTELTVVQVRFIVIITRNKCVVFVHNNCRSRVELKTF
jgi:hypothetical protein